MPYPIVIFFVPPGMVSLQSSSFGGGVSGTGGDILRQDEISFQIAVRGILFSLPHPVCRKAPAAAGFRTGKAADAHRMFYPTSLKLWRMKEEIESTLDLWVTRSMKGEIDLMHTNSMSITSGAAAFSRPKAGTVESWKSKTSAPAPAPSQSKTNPNPQKEEAIVPFLTLGVSAPSDDESELNAHKIENWATDKPNGISTPKKKNRGVIMKKGLGGERATPVQQPEQKFVLSDDDIEDD
ncbi:hypothetical protein DID88_004665 [Monilinia fructigena]|uniref:Uncharacterized protein n=1 Tax=Monilinia fructigena TaxID=38457 RepID=A0A395ITT9_9HELO|nr:hypothetical protein DID88_004665 [Monilinia fructigena]